MASRWRIRLRASAITMRNIAIALLSSGTRLIADIYETAQKSIALPAPWRPSCQRHPKPKRTTMQPSRNALWPRDSQPEPSEIPGTVHTLATRRVYQQEEQSEQNDKTDHSV
jgi:hypothetical protein